MQRLCRTWAVGSCGVSIVGNGFGTCGKGVHQLGIPVSHFAAGVPEGAVHGCEITPFLLLQGLLEGLAAGGVRSDDVELFCQGGVEVVVPADVVAKVQY